MRLAPVALLAVAAVSAVAGDKVFSGPELNYVLHCQGCHLQDGSGALGKVPDLTGSMGLFIGIPGGRDYLARVPGSANAPINDEDLATLLNWMVETFGGEHTPPGWRRYTTAEVTALRKTPLLEIVETRLELVRAAATAAQLVGSGGQASTGY